MLVKTVLVFLLVMAALGLVARALGLGGRGRSGGGGRPRLTAALCPDCGRLRGPGEPCPCGAPPRGGPQA